MSDRYFVLGFAETRAGPHERVAPSVGTSYALRTLQVEKKKEKKKEKNRSLATYALVLYDSFVVVPKKHFTYTFFLYSSIYTYLYGNM